MANTYTLLETVTVGAAGAASVTFNSIPQTGYTDLVIKASSRRGGSGADNYIITFNGVTTGYTFRELTGNGTAASSSSGSSPAYTGLVNGATMTASTFSSSEIYIPNYTSSNYKSFTSDAVTENNLTLSYAQLWANLWSNTAAITSIALAPTTAGFAEYSTFQLYGVSALGTTPTKAPKATGGSIIQTDGTYWYHAFLSSGTFTPATALSCDYLVVAGGGGGGVTAGGGGGAGGYLYATGFNVSGASTVTIGAGGAAGAIGNTSVFSSITAAGGGYGGQIGANGFQGASGGGGGTGFASSFAQGLGGSTVPSGQGNVGGNGNVYASTVDNVSGGGGGGAGGVGGNASNPVSGAGGSGSNALSSWFSVTGSGVSGYIAGGGSGGGNYTNTGKTIGSVNGGGGAGGNYLTAATAGTANTGGGGGGDSQGGGAAGGGSGIVIVRYLA